MTSSNESNVGAPAAALVGQPRHPYTQALYQAIPRFVTAVATTGLSGQAFNPTLEPLGLITPSLDGRITHFYEWREAGYFSAKTARRWFSSRFCNSRYTLIGLKILDFQGLFYQDHAWGRV